MLKNFVKILFVNPRGAERIVIYIAVVIRTAADQELEVRGHFDPFLLLIARHATIMAFNPIKGHFEELPSGDHRAQEMGMCNERLSPSRVDQSQRLFDRKPRTAVITQLVISDEMLEGFFHR